MFINGAQGWCGSWYTECAVVIVAKCTSAHSRIMYDAHITTAASLEIAEILSIKVTRNEAVSLNGMSQFSEIKMSIIYIGCIRAADIEDGRR